MVICLGEKGLLKPQVFSPQKPFTKNKKKNIPKSGEKKHLTFLNINHHLPPPRSSGTEHLLLLCPALAAY